MSEATLLEVRVDRLNEKGVFVAEQILNILHNTVDEEMHGFFHKHQAHFVPYSFEMANIAGVIRFFFRAPRSHVNILQNQIYAHFPNVELAEVPEYLPERKPYISEIALAKDYIRPIKIHTEFKDRNEKETVDPLSSLSSALSKADKKEPVVFQVNFSPIVDSEWKDEHTIEILTSHRPKWLKKVLLSPYGFLFRFFTAPFIGLGKLAMLVVRGNAGGHDGHEAESHGKDHHKEKGDEKNTELEEKFKGFGYAVDMRIASYAENMVTARSALKEVATALNIFARPSGNSLRAATPKLDDADAFRIRTNKHHMLLNSAELAGIVHMPTIYVKTPGINWVVTKKFEPPHNIPTIEYHDDATPIGMTNFRGSEVPFGILPNDRRRHVYVIGKTGMGKSTLLENMIFDDISKGRGVGLVDPHGDLAETILACIPKSRTNDVIVFDPSDYKHPIAFNMLEQVKPELRPIVASGLVSIFKKIF